MGVDWPFGDEPVEFIFTAGLSSRAADLDNVIKPLLDTFQSIYEEFNDNKVYGIQAEKEIVPKGDEYLRVIVQSFRVGTTGSDVPSKDSKKQED